jgi:hypothetical protein
MADRIFHPPHRIHDLAKQIEARANADKIIKVSPVSALRIADALYAFATRPIRNDLIPMICGKDKCPRRRDCYPCISTANSIVQMFSKRED